MTAPTVERPTGVAPADASVEIDPRIRERRVEVRRALGRRRLRVLCVAASIVVLAGLAMLTVYSPFLDVAHVRVAGAHHVTAGEVRRAAHIGKRDALFFVDAKAAARRVESLPWVRSATVRRDFPDTVRIRVREYTPVAFVRSSGDVVLIADDGRAIARVPAPPPGLMEIRNVRHAPAVRELLSPPEAGAVVSQLPSELAPHVVALDVGGEGLSLQLADDGTTHGGAIRLGNADDLAAKNAAALAVLAQRHDTPFAYIDVSTPSMPTVMDR